MMQAMSTRRPGRRMSRSGRIIEVIFVGIVTMLLPSLSSSASMRGELFHREHSFSRDRMPQTKPLSNAEKLHSLGKRSTQRAENLVRRKVAETPQAAPSEQDVTWQTTVNDESPAEYLMAISLGTPAQNFVAVADTGSDLTWLQCAPCQSCFAQSDPIFDPSLSSTYQNLSCSSDGCTTFVQQYGIPFVPSCSPSCEYVYYYGDASNTSGTYSSETINLKSTSGDDFTVPDFWFGCSQASYSPSALYNSADGLVGLGQGLISFPSQLGHVFDDKFSYCLVNRSLAAVQSSLLVFGTDADSEIAFQYTPIISNPAYPFYYFVGVEGISVGGAAVNFSSTALALDCYGNGGTILDSGTTFTYLDPAAFVPLVAAIDATVPESYPRITLPEELSFLELCYNVSGNPDYASVLPDISFKMANCSSWDLGVENAWILLEGIPDDGSFTLCLAISRGSSGGISIIGNTQQQDFQVLYDRVDQRIGFAPADCGAMAP